MRGFTDTGALPAFQFNQFGGSVGGAILKNRTFFFLSCEACADSESAGCGTRMFVSGFSRPGCGAVARHQAAARRLPGPNWATPNPDVGFWLEPYRICRTRTSGPCGRPPLQRPLVSYFRFTRNHAFVRVPVGSIMAACQRR